MRYLLATILFFWYSVSYGQAPTKVPFGGTRPIDTAYAGRSLRVDSVVSFPRYATNDSNKVLGINDSGRLVLRTKSASAAVDTINIIATKYDLSQGLATKLNKTDTVSVIATKYDLSNKLNKSDTNSLVATKYNLSSKLNVADSIGSTGYSTRRYSDSLFSNITPGGNDTVLYSKVATLQLPYHYPVSTVGQIRLADSGSITIRPDGISPKAGAITNIIIVGDGTHTVYAPNYQIENGSNFTGVENSKYLFESRYDGNFYYGKFTLINDSFSCVNYQHPLPNKKAIFFGNSITAGFGVSSSYAVKFTTLANDTLINKGVSGMTMQQSPLHPNFFVPANIPAYDTIQGYMFISLGVNDYIQLNAGTYGFNLANYRYDYINALDTAVARGWPSNRIMLITPFYCPAVASYIEARYAKVATELATSYNTGLFDAFNKMLTFPGINSLFQGDNVHPNQILQDSLGSWLYQADFRTQLQKQCTDSSTQLPVLNYPYATQRGLNDTALSFQYEVNEINTNKITKGGDTVSVPLYIGTLTAQPLYFKTNANFAMAVTTGGQIAINKSLSNGQQLDVHGAIRTDSTLYGVWLARTRNDISTGVSTFNVPSFPNFSAEKIIRAGGGFAWFQTFDATKFLKSYDPIEGYNYDQTSSIDTVKYYDATTTLPTATSYQFYVTRVTSPNLPMLQGYVTYSTAGVPAIKINRPNGSIIPSVSSSNKVVFSTASGQLKVGIKPYIDRSGNGFFPVESYLVARDSLCTNVGIGAGNFSVNTTSGNTTVNNISYASATPTVTYGTGAGTSPTGTSIAGNNKTGLITFTAGTSPATNATVLTINLSGSFTYTTRATLQLSAENNNASDVLGATNYTTTGTSAGVSFAIRGIALTAGQQYIISYTIDGY